MHRDRLKVLIIGGYGTFGSRLVRLLSNDPRIDILVAGRSPAKAADFCHSVRGPARLTPVYFDRDGDVDALLARSGPDIVVDASGPWQAYGTRPYRIPRAALSQGVHYMDIADGRAFVQGIAELDEEARQRRVVVLSGASTCPALTGAVYRRLTMGLVRAHSIAGGIAPSPFAPMGRSVLEAIAGYAGKPLAVWRDEQPATEPALVSARDFTIAPPGVLPLPRMRFLLVDVPDLDLLRDSWVPVGTAWFGVSTRPAMFLRLLRLTARGVSVGIFRSLTWLVSVMQFVTNRLNRGEDRGGMYVRVVGENAQGRVEDRSWHLVADGDAGPHVPVLAPVIVIRRMLDGRLPAAGARPASAEFGLDDFEPLFDELGIETGRRVVVPQVGVPLFRRVLGEAWDRIPGPVRDGHSVSGELVLAGSGQVVRGHSRLSRAIASVFGFPPDAANVPVVVRMREARGVEAWQRDFGGHRFSSSLRAGKGRLDGLVVERFGPVSIAMALTVDGAMLRYTPRHWTFLGVPLPKALLPRGDMHESAAAGRFRFHVEVRLPVVGHLVTYEGTLSPDF